MGRLDKVKRFRRHEDIQLGQNVIVSPEFLARAATGFVLAATAVIVAVRTNSLSRSGGFAALAIGTIAVAAGWTFAIVLFSFFALSTVLSKYRRALKESRTSSIVEKGGRRDASQVFANGGVFAVAALWFIVSPNRYAEVAAIASLAGAMADTAATEIGSLASALPRSIMTGRKVPVGTSGGVTLLGAFSAVPGAAFIALLASLLRMTPEMLTPILLGGLAGAAADSILGASLQTRRWCAQCKLETERPVHTCGSKTSILGGIAWINNDAVNFFCTFVAAGVAALWVF